MLARIIEGQLQQGLPNNGTLKDGRTVSHYDLLPSDILTAEGWREVSKNIPELTKEQYLEIESFTDDGINIIINYKAVAM